jgi:hypothetical protein
VCAQAQREDASSAPPAHLGVLDHIAELADRWRDDGHIPPDSYTKAVAASIFSSMHGLIVMHHLVHDVRADALRNGVSLLGAGRRQLQQVDRNPTTGRDAMTDIKLTDLAADRAEPETGPWPGVVMIDEIFGLDDVMHGRADRIAGLGYLTLAVDLFSAGGTALCAWSPP